MSASLFVDNNNIAEVRNLRNSVSGDPDVSATVTITIKNASGAEIAGHTWPLVLTHVANGTYQVTLDDQIAITASSNYTAEVNVTGTGGLTAKWTIPVKAITRTA